MLYSPRRWAGGIDASSSRQRSPVAYAGAWSPGAHVVQSVRHLDRTTRNILDRVDSTFRKFSACGLSESAGSVQFGQAIHDHGYPITKL